MLIKFKFFAFLFIIIIITFSARTTPVYAATTITTCAELQDIDLDLAEDYLLGGDIDCTGFPFTPLGTFTGTLDGDNHTIDNLTITGFSNDHALFADTDGATIKNITITNATVEGNYQTALLVAVAVDTTILNVALEGNIQSSAILSLTGAFAGRMSGGSIIRGSADVNIIGYEFVGGLVGSATDGALIKKSYATGSINTIITSGNAANGGLVGELIDSQISNSYSDITISAHGDSVGGLVGTSEGNSYILNSYAVGGVTSTGTMNIGGLVGREVGNATTVNSYWDMDATLQMISAGGEGKTTAEMQDEDTFDNWDFENIWELYPSAYPTFLPPNPALPVLTQIRGISRYTSDESPTFHFIASEDGEYTFEICGATVLLDLLEGIVSFQDLEVGETYGGCSFNMMDDDGNVSNALTINEFTLLGESGSLRTTGRSRGAVLALYNNSSIRAPFNRTLSLGSVGEDVKLLQEFLNTHGFPLVLAGRGSAGNETTVFGPRTLRALVQFQNAHAEQILAPFGLKAGTGVVGMKTREVMNRLLQ